MKFSGPRLWSRIQLQRVSGALRLVLRAHSRAPFRLRLCRAVFFAALRLDFQRGGRSGRGGSPRVCCQRSDTALPARVWSFVRKCLSDELWIVGDA